MGHDPNSYTKGYWAGSRRKWPEHKPPLPPVEIIARMYKAAISLRDAADAACATFDPDDEICQIFNPEIDEVDRACADVSKWLKSIDGTTNEDASNTSEVGQPSTQAKSQPLSTHSKEK